MKYGTDRPRSGWNSLLGAIRTRTSLPADLRELAILRPALLNRAWFEWNHHLPLLLATPSFSDPATSTAKIQVLQSISPTSQGALSDREWAVLRYADAMTGDITVPDELFAEIRRSFSEQEVVELTATVACYNMVSRFLVALDVGEQNALEPRFA